MYRFSVASFAPACRLVDAAVAAASLVLVLIMMNLPAGAWQPASFLEAPISLKYALLLCGTALAWPWVFSAFGLYHFRELDNASIELGRIAKACALGSVFAVVAVLTSVSAAFGMRAVLAFWLTVTVGTACARAIVRSALSAATRRSANAHYVVIAGTGPRAVRIYQQLTNQLSCTVLGFVDTVGATPLLAAGPPLLGTVNDLEQILASRQVDVVHIGLPVRSCYRAIEQVISTCERVGVESCYDADIFPPSRGRPVAHDTAALLVSRKVVTDDYRLWVKRGIDVAGALIGLVVFSPVMLAAAVAIRLTSPGPAIFIQERVGFNRRRLKMYKFRTMVADATARLAELEHLNEKDGPIFKIRDDPRVTPVGRFLRWTSIDELPQLWHVLKGDMSLVGPRPMAVRDVSRFPEASLMRRFSVKPGLTCLWQINGRSNTSFDRWIELDLEYIDRWSLALDLRILAKTVPVVLLGVGAV